MYVPDPPELQELREYLVGLKKIQKQKEDNIYLPFSSWSWSGGFFWTRVKGQRVKNYLEKYNEVFNKAVHPVSFNTCSTKSVYHSCHIECDPVLDQHSGINQQNLFDNFTVVVDPDKNRSYNLFKGGGAGYWKPSHAAYSTFWNIGVHFTHGHDSSEPVVLKGMDDGPRARLVGVHGNLPVKIEYGPAPYIEATNTEMSVVPSLYEYQLMKRLK